MKLAKQLFTILLSVFTVTFTFVHAKGNYKNDNQQPLKIISDSLNYDHLKGIATYHGHVVATQGSRILNTQELRLFRTSDGKIDKIIAKGNSSTFKAKTEKKDSIITARADVIEFSQQLNQLLLQGNASVEQNGDSYKAPEIKYDIKREIISSPASKHGRTTIFIQPNNQS